MSVRPRSRRRRGFTLIEVLLVLVILAMLASLAVGTYTRVRVQAQKNAAKTQIGLFSTPLETYRLDVNQYPVSLDSLCVAPGDLPNPDKWNGPYLKPPIPLDPWDNPYQYVTPGKQNPESYDVWSMGPDGVDGTEDDIGNWAT